MTRVCYLTGVPGVGKTTLSETLVSKYPSSFSHIRFGRLIISSLKAMGRDVTEHDLRLDAARLVSRQTLQAATSLLFDEVLEKQGSGVSWVLIDSHAVSQDWFGFVATPDSHSYFLKIKYAAIVHLYADPAVVLSRSEPERSGRRAQSAEDIYHHEALLRSVTIAYSVLSACPAYFLSSEGTPESLAERVNKILCDRAE